MKKILNFILVIIFCTSFSACDRSKDPSLIASVGNKYGFLSTRGEVAIPLEYDELRGFFDNGLAIAKKNNKYGSIDKNNNTIIPFEYDNIDDFKPSSPLVAAKKNDKWGFINTSGDIAIPFIYDDYKSGYDSHYIVKKELNWGVVDIENEQILPFTYQDLIYIENNIFGFQNNNLWGYLELDGDNINEIIPATYEEISKFSEGLAVIKLNGFYGYIDYLGELVIDAIYTKASPYVSGFAVVQQMEYYGVINRKKDIHLPFFYDDIQLLTDNEYILIKDNIVAVSDLRFNIIINHNFIDDITKIGSITNFGLFGFCLEGKFGVISKRNRVVVETIYEAISYNKDCNIFAVKEYTSWGIIDSRGFVIINSIYDYMTIISNELIVAVNNGMSGLLTRGNEQLTRFEYDSIYSYHLKTTILNLDS